MRGAAERRHEWKEKILLALQAEGVPGLSGSCPEIYREEAMVRKFGAPRARLETARSLGETSIMFPVHPTLEASDVDDFVCALSKILTAAAR